MEKVKFERIILLNLLILLIQCGGQYILWKSGVQFSELYKSLPTLISSTIAIMISLNVALLNYKQQYIEWFPRIRNESWVLLVDIVINNHTQSDIKVESVLCRRFNRNYVPNNDELTIKSFETNKIKIKLEPSSLCTDNEKSVLLYIAKKSYKVRIGYRFTSSQKLMYKSIVIPNPHYKKWAYLMYFQNQIVNCWRKK